MNRKSNLLKKKIMVSIVIITLLLSFFSLILNRKETKIESIFNETFQTIEYYVVKCPIQFFRNIGDELHHVREVYNENKVLKSALNDYMIIKSQNDVLKDEINDLKGLTEFTSIPVEYKAKKAIITSRDIESWNSQILINVGGNQGIKEGMTVITTKGMIGKISSVSEFSSVVTLLTSENNMAQVPIMIKKQGSDEYAYGVLTHFDVEKQCFVVDMLDDDPIDLESEVYTSGTGGLSPRGIIVGTVSDIVVPPDRISPQVYVKPAATFDDLKYVMVLEKGE